MMKHWKAMMENMPVGIFVTTKNELKFCNKEIQRNCMQVQGDDQFLIVENLKDDEQSNLSEIQTKLVEEGIMLTN